MSFNWTEYLALAQQLAGKAKISATQESRLRSAISRAYYAAFIQARNHLRDRDGLAILRKSTHDYVINQFKNSPESVRQDVGRILKRLRSNRNRADYDDKVASLPELTKQTIKLAAKLIAKLQGL
ncbi:MAG: HEPN domain-containing protein [Oscillatoria sp. SIO1A7]|nr:HEPN domain-containing protein [Oscillatoria sp. SIO1A7]